MRCTKCAREVEQRLEKALSGESQLVWSDTRNGEWCCVIDGDEHTPGDMDIDTHLAAGHAYNVAVVAAHHAAESPLFRTVLVALLDVGASDNDVELSLYAIAALESLLPFIFDTHKTAYDRLMEGV